MVTLSLAFLAHRFGIVGTFQPHGQTICEKPCAIQTERNIFLLDLLDIEEPETKGFSISVMILPAVDFYKIHQDPNI
jgi:hypothetical protein